MTGYFPPPPPRDSFGDEVSREKQRDGSRSSENKLGVRVTRRARQLRGICAADTHDLRSRFPVVLRTTRERERRRPGVHTTPEGVPSGTFEINRSYVYVLVQRG